MSSQSYQSYSSSTSYTTSSGGGRTTGQAYSQQAQSDSSGTRVKNTSQTLGEPPVSEYRQYDPQGRQLVEGQSSGGADRRIEGSRVEDVTDEQEREVGRKYEERMEDEYAKREGGA